MPGSAALAPDHLRPRHAQNGARAADAGVQPPQPDVGTPEAGGAGCVPVYGVIALPAAGVVVSGPPERTILPFLTIPISAPE